MVPVLLSGHASAMTSQELDFQGKATITAEPCGNENNMGHANLAFHASSVRRSVVKMSC